MRKPKSPLSGWIVEQRKERGWKSEELARRLDVSESTVRSWEAGRGVSPDNLDRMERLFGVQAPGGGGDGQGDVADAIREQTEVMRVQTLLLAELLTAVRPGPGRLDIDKILDEFEATHPRRGTGSLPRPVRDRTGAGSAQLADPATAASGKQA